MKNFLLLFVLASSLPSFAGTKVVEFDENQEKQCYTEIQAMGCGDKSDAEITRCVESKKTKLSSECRAMHSERTKNL